MEDQGVTVDGSAMSAYVQGLPFAFYAWFAVIVCILQIIGVIPKIGPMKKAYERYETLGDVFPEGTDPEIVENAKTDDIPEGVNPHPWNFLIPLIVMIAVTLLTGTDVLMGTAASDIVAFAL